MTKLSHIDESNRPTMVDVSDKTATQRTAHARTVMHLPADVVAELDGVEISTRKGPVFATAVIAGVMAAKKTHELIPFCHPLGLENCKITIDVSGSDAVIDCHCKVHHKTGVEMEALTAASVGCLTIYDMLKYTGQGMTIGDIKLLEKQGGKSGRAGFRGPFGSRVDGAGWRRHYHPR